jgi:hypothetical protein
MKRTTSRTALAVMLVAGLSLAQVVQADFELADRDGRRILLKDNGTWQYVDGTGKEQPGEGAKDPGTARLQLERRTERGNGCRFAVRLVNTLSFEIRSFVPSFAIYRANGVMYDTVSSRSSFASLKPGDRQDREFEVNGIACQDIARVQVVGGDRCEMGELHKFSDGKGQCLARVDVVPSDLVRFDK